MTSQLSRKMRRMVAVMILAGSASTLSAQQPPASTPAEEPIEIYYGTKRANPEPPPSAEPSLVVPASAVEAAPSPPAFSEAMASLRDGTRDITSATVGLLGKVGDRVKQTEVRPIVIAAYPQAPAPAQPQVVVVRESAEPRPAVEAPATVRLETLLIFGFGMLAVGVAAWAGFRQTRKTAPASFAIAPLPLDPNAVNLMGKYNAGPKREAAETFDIGNTYHDDLNQKKLAEEAGNAAAVEFILGQNLALLAELNPGHDGAMVETDAEGFAPSLV